MNVYFTYESCGTLKSFTLFISVKAITKLNLWHIDKSEIKIYKTSRQGLLSPDNTEFGYSISHSYFAEDGKEMYQEL